MMNGYIIVSDSNNDRHIIIPVDKVVLTDNQIEQLLSGTLQLRVTVQKNQNSGYNEPRGKITVITTP